MPSVRRPSLVTFALDPLVLERSHLLTFLLTRVPLRATSVRVSRSNVASAFRADCTRRNVLASRCRKPLGGRRANTTTVTRSINENRFESAHGRIVVRVVYFANTVGLLVSDREPREARRLIFPRDNEYRTMGNFYDNSDNSRRGGTRV